MSLIPQPARVLAIDRPFGHSIAIEDVSDSAAVGAPQRKFRIFEYLVHWADACREGGDGFVRPEFWRTTEIRNDDFFALSRHPTRWISRMLNPVHSWLSVWCMHSVFLDCTHIEFL